MLWKIKNTQIKAVWSNGLHNTQLCYIIQGVPFFLCATKLYYLKNGKVHLQRIWQYGYKIKQIYQKCNETLGVPLKILIFNCVQEELDTVKFKISSELQIALFPRTFIWNIFFKSLCPMF